ncbi:MAG: type II toxin-antitoxin system HipA family toxin, partial [Verrucomicrobia bacterium]|nr:type II toxin-antitoxin system HipA family toxin [Verrucomicrobiota bacterium]
MADFEAHLSLGGQTRRMGLARSNRVRGKETVHFEYADAWLA